MLEKLLRATVVLGLLVFSVARAGAEEPNAFLRGSVRGAETGVPASSVTIEIWNESGHLGSDFTDQNGVFSFEVPAGRYFLAVIEKDRTAWGNQLYFDQPCVPGDCDVRMGTPVDVAAGQTVEGLDFRLPEAGRIRGNVRRADGGSGLPSGLVKIFDHWASLKETVVLDQGRYESRGLADGNYYVVVAEVDDAVPQIWGGGPFCEAGVLNRSCDPRSGSPVLVRGGAITEADFAVETGGRLSGRVFLPDGRPATGGITFHLRDSQFLAGVGIVDGVFESNPLAPGRYYLQVYVEGYPRQIYPDFLCLFDCDLTLGATVEVRNGQTTSNLEFRLHDFGRIAGSVKSRSGAVLPSASVQLYNASTRMQESGGFKFVEADGSFVLDKVAPGRYFLAASAPDGYEAQLFGGVPFPNPADPSAFDQATSLLVSDGGSLGRLDFRLDRWGRIEGRLLAEETGEPLPEGAAVLAFVEGQRGSYFAAAGAGPDGAFTLALPAGTYYLIAESSEGRTRLVGTEEVCPSYRPTREPTCDVRRGQAFRVQGGVRVSAGVVELPQMARLRGRVRREASAHGTLFVYSQDGRLVEWQSLGEGPDWADFEVVVPGGGRYFLEAGAYEHFSQLYQGVECPDGFDDFFGYACPNPRAGTPVDVGPAEIREGLDFDLRLGNSPCTTAPFRLCLADGRFSVRMTDDLRIFQTQELTRDSGILGGGTVLVKVLDACRDFGRFWFFAGSAMKDSRFNLTVRDRYSRVVQHYSRQPDENFLTVADLSSFATCGVTGPEPTVTTGVVKAASNPAGCGGDPAYSLCLGGRFRVEAEWQTPSGESGLARPLAFSDKTGFFSFFGPDNLELSVTLEDFCTVQFSPRFGIRVSGITDVAVQLKVTDSQTGAEKIYWNPQGRFFEPILDLGAFAACR